MWSGRIGKLALLGMALWPAILAAQKPIISPSGVVNAASYATSRTYLGNQYLSGGSIASIFGTNLAASAQEASVVPLPVSLAGTSVTVNGIEAPLFFVSPSQINFQVPSPAQNATPSGVVVTTAAGASDPYPMGAGGDTSIGIFTLDGSGCGRGDIFNVAADGTLSLNSPANSVSPGQYLAIYGTGLGLVSLVTNPPPDGSPAPSSPLATSAIGAGAGVYDFVPALSGPYNGWDGRAPALIGVDQFNLQLPATTREGCAVPFQVEVTSLSQPVTIAVRNGGGTCVDPPEAGYGTITWERAFTGTSSSPFATETDTVTVSLQASPGKQAPPTSVFMDSNVTLSGLPGHYSFFGPSCPVPGYRSLAAGTVTVQGPGFGPVAAPAAPLQEGQVSGLTVYQATLPPGSIQAGTFTAAASGGADVGAFQSSIQMGAAVQFTTSLSGFRFPCNQPVKIGWSGGDPQAWVTVNRVNHNGTYDAYMSWQARVSDGTLTLPALFPPSHICNGPGVPVDLLIEVDPDPSETVAFSAPGLSLGGLHTWKYTYRYPASQPD